MSVGAVVGVALVLGGSGVWAVGTARLARANPGEFIPRATNAGWGGYRRYYLAGLFGATFGGVVLPNEVGLWWATAVLVAAFVPYLAITTVHRRRVRARARGGQLR